MVPAKKIGIFLISGFISSPPTLIVSKATVGGGVNLKIKMNAVLLVISLQKQNILKRFKDVCFSYFPKLLKIGQNSDSVAVYYEQNFKSTMTCIYLCARTIITVVKKLNIIVSMKIFTKYNSNLLIQECIIISKKLCYNHVTF